MISSSRVVKISFLSFHMWRYRFRHLWWRVCNVSLLNEPKFIDLIRNIFGSSSAIYGNLRKSSENVRKRSYDLRTTFRTSSEIFGKWSEIFGKSSKTSLLVCCLEIKIYLLVHIKLNTRRYISYLRATMYYAIFIDCYRFLPIDNNRLIFFCEFDCYRLPISIDSKWYLHPA